MHSRAKKDERGTESSQISTSTAEKRDPETQRVKNLKMVLNFDSQLFLLNLCQGVVDIKQ